MQELNRIKANLPQQCELIGDWAGRVFLVNIGKNFLPRPQNLWVAL